MGGNTTHPCRGCCMLIAVSGHDRNPSAFLVSAWATSEGICLSEFPGEGSHATPKHLTCPGEPAQCASSHSPPRPTSSRPLRALTWAWSRNPQQFCGGLQTPSCLRAEASCH